MRDWLICAVLWAIFAPGLSQAQLEPAPATSAASREMVAYLDRIARQADPILNAYMNRARAAGISTLLGQKLAPAQEMQLRVKIATELLHGGETAKAIAQFEYVYAEIERRQVPVAESYKQMLRDHLAIAYLRLGGEESGTPPHSWIFPMGRDQATDVPAGPLTAIKIYQAHLEREPDNLTARWLLNVAYMTLGQYPNKVPKPWLIPPAVFASEYDIGSFVDIAAAAGVDVVGHAGGSIVEDFDGDGLLDIVASSRGLRDQLRLFHNAGDGTFPEQTDQAGLRGQFGGLNLAHADYDNDGDRDLLVLRGAWMGEEGRHPNTLLQNQGRGTFEDVTRATGIFSLHPSHSGAWGDYDNDGLLDLYIGNESSPDPRPAHPCELFRNNGDGTFSEVAAAVGVADVGFVKGLAWGDYDNDGMLDLYLSHLNGYNVLYHNEGGYFSEVAKTAEVRDPYVSFPTWFWDYDNDGWQDILVAGFDMAELDDMAAIYLDQPFAAEYPRLYHNQGNGTFEDVTVQTGLDRVILPMGANFGDLDNDGWLDAYFGTGMPDLRALLPNRMFRNAKGERFQDVTTSGGFGTLQKGHGISFADFDHDGDQDIYQVLGAAFEGDVYHNALLENPGHGNHWLTLLLQGNRSNRDAIGARIRVGVKTEGGQDRDIYITVGSGGSFGSSPLRQEIGLGQASAINFVEIVWPASNQTQRFVKLKMDRAYRLLEGDPQPQSASLQRFDLSPGGS
ncbi:MAG: CRTAC1 family protein [Candidatus Latescibacterota bacterium]|jgi:hypothetical protein